MCTGRDEVTWQAHTKPRGGERKIRERWRYVWSVLVFLNVSIMMYEHLASWDIQDVTQILCSDMREDGWLCCVFYVFYMCGCMRKRGKSQWYCTCCHRVSGSLLCFSWELMLALQSPKQTYSNNICVYYNFLHGSYIFHWLLLLFECLTQHNLSVGFLQTASFLFQIRSKIAVVAPSSGSIPKQQNKTKQKYNKKTKTDI